MQAERTSRWNRLLRAAVYALGAVLLLAGIALGPGLVAGVVGALAGLAAAEWLARTALRTGVVLVIGLLVVAVGGGCVALLTGLSFVPSWVGVDVALQLSDALGFGLTLGGVALSLRTVAVRVPSLGVLETGVAVAVVAGMLASHRDHHISRPRSLSDWAWSRGDDPVWLLLAIGAMLLFAGAVLLLESRRARKGALALGALLLAAVGAFSWFEGEPLDSMGDATGRKEKEEEKTRERPGNHSPGDLDGMPMPRQDDEDRPQPVAVVVFHDDYEPPDGFHYFRQTAFSQFNGRKLVRAVRKDVDTDIVTGHPGAPMDLPHPYLMPEAFVEVPTRVAVVTDQRNGFGLVHPVAYAPADNPNPVHFHRAFDVVSLAPATSVTELLNLEAGDPSWSGEVWEHYLEHPNDERYRELSFETVQLLPERLRHSPMARALAIRRWMEKNAIYTLSAGYADDEDATARFLFEERRGYCVHIAHSIAYLLRAQGLPARVATGYVADDARRAGGSALLLQTPDAHAWAELYLHGAGWVVVDATPEQIEGDLPKQIDPQLQQILGELARGDRTAGRGLEARSSDASLLREILRWWPLPVVLSLLVLFGVKLWRRLIAVLGPTEQLPRLTYRAALDGLAEAGQLRRFGETREAFARRLSSVTPSLVALTDLHLRAAFARAAIVDAARLRGLRRDVAQELRSGCPWWRMLLGALDPTSWLRVR